MLLKLYGLASSIQNAIAPVDPLRLNRWEKSTLKHLQATSFRIAESNYDSELLGIVQGVYDKFHLKEKPKVVLYEHKFPNAVFLGTTNTVFISTQLLNLMNRDEVEAVVGHELGHRMQRQTNILVALGVTAATFVASNYLTHRFNKNISQFFEEKVAPKVEKNKTLHSATLGISRFVTNAPLMVAVVFSMIAGLVGTALAFPHAAFRRYQELDADKQSAIVLHKPEALISALDKLQTFGQLVRRKQIPPTDHALKRVEIPPPPPEPQTEQQKFFAKNLASHPDNVTREKQLREIAAKQHHHLSI